MKLEDLPQTALLLVFVGVIMVSGFLVLQGLTDDAGCPTGWSFDESNNLCQEDANASHWEANMNYAGNSSIALQEGMDNITDYASTWGTIVGVAVLLSLVIFGLAFGRGKGWY